MLAGGNFIDHEESAASQGKNWIIFFLHITEPVETIDWTIIKDLGSSSELGMPKTTGLRR